MPIYCHESINKNIVMRDGVRKIKFENLQPMKFLRTFNKMIDEDSKHLPKESERELKMFQLSKFPLPHFYETMEGIFETGTKKHEVRDSSRRDKDDLQSENFLNKNREFMSKHLSKLIQEGREHQRNLQQGKQQENQQQNQQEKQSIPTKKSMRSLRVKSEVKLRKKKSNIPSTGPKSNTGSLLLNKLVRVSELESPEDRVQPTYMQKLHQERMESFKKQKKENIKLRSKEQIVSYLASRKEGLSHEAPEACPKVEAVKYDQITSEDRKKQFVRNLISLEQEQNDYQRTYNAKIEGEIKSFGETIQTSIARVKSMRVD